MFHRIGAKNLFIIRHGERLDRINPNWALKALRPQDTPLSQMGHEQARRLGKWLYSKIPIRTPTKIFCSPFIRCVQTANEIAEQLACLEDTGTFSDNISDICIEPGICEDPRYLNDVQCREPFFLNAADLMAMSHRIKLNYNPIRSVTYKESEENIYIEDNICSTDERLHNIIHEIIKHPYVQDDGTAIVVTHAKPSVDMLRSLNPIVDGIKIPHYEKIKKGHYDGPPLQYTACTHMIYDNNTWNIKYDSKLFSNEHDPNLKNMRKYKRKKIIRYVYEENILKARDKYIDNPSIKMCERKILQSDIVNKKPGDLVKLIRNNSRIEFRIPSDYNNGDRIIVKCIC